MTTTLDLRPWLLLDVDGVLNVICSNSQAKKRRLLSRSINIDGQRYRVHLNLDHGPWLREMTGTFRLAWCTTWQHHAPLRLGNHIGLDLPVIEFDRDEASKVPGILRFLGSEPFVWLDDAVSARDRDLLAASAGKHLVIDVDPVGGLTREYLDEARDWAHQRTQQ